MEHYSRFLLATFVFLAGLTKTTVLGAARLEMNSVQNDVSDVTWAHAVNSWSSLEKALAGAVDFMEADVSLGQVTGSEEGPPIPIMAHPPDTSSDISLDHWLSTVVKRGPQKGLKLDFKSIEVVEPSLLILQNYASKLNGSLWLSADILPGPVSSRAPLVQSDVFLALCNRFFPRATLSLGWTTNWIRRYPSNAWLYDWKHVRQMADVVRCWFKDNNPPLVFSVRAIYAARSTRQLNWLLDVVPRSSLLVWQGIGDGVDVDDVLRIQRSFPREKLYFDLPNSLCVPYKKGKSKSFYKKKLNGDSWMTVRRDKRCESFNYIDDSTVLFGRPSDSVVFQKNLVPVDGSRNFTLSGRLKFFAGNHLVNPAHWEHKLSVVFADVSDLSKYAKYSKKKSTYSISDSQSLWTAVNSSVLYTFEHPYFQDSSACRMFKIEYKSNLSFESWTIPCDPTYDDNSYEEVAKGSISEVNLEESFEKGDRIFMIGLHSLGEEYVLVYDLNLDTQINEKEPSLDVPKLQLALTSSTSKLGQDFAVVAMSLLAACFSCLCSSIFCDIRTKRF